MDVILLERIEKLGQMGDVVKVKPGFARNFLLPNKKALRATEANKKVFEAQRAQLETENLKLKGEADSVATKMAGTNVTLIRQAGESGQLYGSVNARDIASALTEAGFTANRSQVALSTPIKALGFYEVRVDLHPEVNVNVNVNVARSDEEAQIQAKTGKAVVGEEEARAAEHAPELEEVFEEEALEEAAGDIAAEEATDEATDEGAVEGDAPNADAAAASEEGEKAE